MTRSTRFLTIAALVGFAAAAAGSATAECLATENTSGGDRCCFTNPRYAGVCEVTPGADETCGSILSYLNNQASVGKTYCGNTKVRGGWSQVECEGASSMCASPIATVAEANPSE